MLGELSTIGQSVAMLDAPQKVSGDAKYTADLVVPGMLVGKILHSHLPHARIRRIDTSRAEAIPGVRCVIVGSDAPIPYGILPIGKDECALQPDKVRYIGDNVACVVAVDEHAAEDALPAIDVEYQNLPAYFDAETAMAAPPEGWLHDSHPGNIEKEYHHVFGTPEAAMADADAACEATYVCPGVTHVAMEPHSTLARFDDYGSLTVWSSTQVPHYLRMTLSRVLELPMERVRVIKPMVGGGFGGKSEVCPLEVIAAMAARKSKAPVKITYTREEVFYAHRGRPEQVTYLKTGATREGKIVSVIAKVIQDGGAYCGYGPVSLLYSGALLGAMYDIANIRWDGYRILTNKPTCGAMRGHGTVNTRFAFECQLDELAEKIGMDPAELRRRNFLQVPYETVNRLRVLSYGLPECMDKVLKNSGFDKRAGDNRWRTSSTKRGRGLACSHYVSGAANAINRSGEPHSTVKIEAEPDGVVTVFTGTAEIGQGSDTMQAQIVAECLGLTVNRVRVVAADTALTPVDLGSYSSRVTFMAGNAALAAATNLREKVGAAVGTVWQCSHDELIFANGQVQLRSGERRLSFGGAVAAALTLNTEASAGRLCATGSYAPPQASQGGEFKGAGVGPSPAYSYSAQVADVSVDEDTGEVRVNKIWAAHDCGRALNPVAVKGQVIGSVWMGLGQALSEEMVYGETGQLVNPSMLEYRVPSSAESPDIDAEIVESIDPEGPFGAKEAGEGSLAAAIPAVANAIYDAVGIRLYATPFTPDRVLKALKRKRARSAGAHQG